MTDRPVLKETEEIEITAEMIEAGYRVLLAAGLTDDLLEADRLTVADIYRAMMLLAPTLSAPRSLI